MHHLTCGINSLLHSVNLIVFTLLLVHLILRISPYHSDTVSVFSLVICHSLSDFHSRLQTRLFYKIQIVSSIVCRLAPFIKLNSDHTYCSWLFAF